MDEIFFLFFSFMDCYSEASLHILSHRSSPQSERDIHMSPVRSHESIDRAQFQLSPKQTSPPFTPSPLHLIQPQNHTLIIPRLPIQIQPRRHITFPPIRPIIRTIPIPRIRLQPLQFQRRRCRFNHGKLLKCEHNRGGFVRREELDRGPVFRC